ncbi:MAG: cytochrome c oxidase assembly protein [Alphaproteobacteria bacterium]|nr:MAG: cytochrome c oxidase assembly protein [Alphaproteobacteria bacterium]
MSRERRNARLVLALAGLVLFMGAMSFVAVPFYNWFCRVTGYGGTTQVAEKASDKVLDREIRVSFDASIDDEVPLTIRPEARHMTLRIGQTAMAFYVAHNPTDQPIATTASYNVVPYSAGSYFIKVQCFCFTEQVLAPGETRRMPVSFFVDPDIVNDREAKYTRDITLSYAFHRDELPDDAAGTGKLN